MLLGQLGEAHALLQVGVLHQVHENVGLGIVGVEPSVGGRIIVLHQDHGVLPADDLHIVGIQVAVLLAGLAEDVDGEAVGRGPADGIDVDGYEEVGFRLVGDLRPALEGHVAVVGAGQNHIDVGIGGTNLVGQRAGDIKDERLLVVLLVAAHGAGILAAVTGIDHDRGEPEFVSGGKYRTHEHGKEKADCSFQKIVVIL